MSPMPGHATPEESARDDVPAEFVRVVGVVVRGNRAIVAQLMNDFPTAYEIETAFCIRNADGLWEAESSGNGDSGHIITGEGRATVVTWDVAPENAVRARFVCRDRELMVDVRDGCVLAVFDDMPFEDETELLLPSPDQRPRLQAWIAGDGTETLIEYPPTSPWLNERIEKLREHIRDGTPFDGPDVEIYSFTESDEPEPTG